MAEPTADELEALFATLSYSSTQYDYSGVDPWLRPRADEAERLHALAQTRPLTAQERHELAWHERIPGMDIRPPPSVRWAAIRKLVRRAERAFSAVARP